MCQNCIVIKISRKIQPPPKSSRLPTMTTMSTQKLRDMQPSEVPRTVITLYCQLGATIICYSLTIQISQPSPRLSAFSLTRAEFTDIPSKVETPNSWANICGKQACSYFYARFWSRQAFLQHTHELVSIGIIFIGCKELTGNRRRRSGLLTIASSATVYRLKPKFHLAWQDTTHYLAEICCAQVLSCRTCRKDWRSASKTVFVKQSRTHTTCFRFYIFQMLTPRAQNTKPLQAIAITISSAVMQQAGHITTSTRHDLSCRVEPSGILALPFIRLFIHSNMQSKNL